MIKNKIRIRIRMEEQGIDRIKIIRYFRGEYSEADELYVNEIFCDNNKKDELIAILFKDFYEFLPDNEVNRERLDHILYRINYNINARSSTQKSLMIDKLARWGLRLAGIIILPIVILMGIYTYKKEASLRKDAWIEIKTPAWTRAQFNLPDGTTGWLNNNSSIKYNGNFISDRRLMLIGEAFFDVSSDKKRPFKVNTDKVMLTVTGTRFNIASYEDENNVEVVLEEGSLIFNDKIMSKSYTMKPNDLLVYDKTSGSFSTETVQPVIYSSWTEGKLVFRNDPPDVIERRLERFYNVDVEIDQNYDEDIRLRATFVDEGLEGVLNILKHSLPMDYRIEDQASRPDDVYSKKKVVISFRKR